VRKPSGNYLNYIYFIAGLVIIGLSVFLWPRGTKASIPTFGTPTANKTVLNKYEMFELTIPLSATYDNPFRASATNETFVDGNQTQSGYGITLDAYIQLPLKDGVSKTIKVPGFYNVDYKTPMADNPNNTNNTFAVNSGWRWNIRYAGSEAGTYKYYLKVVDKNGSTCYPTNCSPSSSTQFLVGSTPDPKTPHGFVRKSTKNPGFFEYDDGTPFVQIGSQMDAFDIYKYPTLAANGFNFSRTWLTNGAQSSIFRNTTPAIWRAGVKDNEETYVGYRHYSTDAKKTGKFGLKTAVGPNPSFSKTTTLAPSGTILSSQNNIGALPSTCYTASAWVKTANSFNGTLTFSAATDGRSPIRVNSQSLTGVKDWTELTVGPFKTPSDANHISITSQLNSSAKGDVYMDDVALFQTTQSNGVCSNTHAYAPNEVNLLWDPGYEYGNPMGNPSVLFMENLGRFEYIVKQAEVNGVVLQPCIFDYKVWGNYSGDKSNWAAFYGSVDGDANIYSNFWKTDTNEFKSQQYALRYLIARYGYSPAIGFWELTNEMYRVDKATNSDAPDHLVWVNAIGDYLKSIDYNNRLMTNSYNNGYDYTTFADPAKTGIEIYSRHNYIYDETTHKQGRDEITYAINTFRYFKENGYGNTLLTTLLGLGGEYGVVSNLNGQHNSHWVDVSEGYVAKEGLTPTQASVYCQSDGTNCDNTGIVFHNTLWASAILQGFKNVHNVFSGELLFNNVYGDKWIAQAKGVSYFSKKLPFYNSSAQILATPDIADVNATSLMDLVNGSTISVVQPTSSNANIRAFGRKSGEQAFLWVQNAHNIWGDRIQQKQSISNVSGDLTIPGFTANKQFTVSYYNTYNARVTRTATVNSDSTGKIKLTSSVSGGIAGIVLGTDTNAINNTDSRPDVAIIITPTSSIKPIVNLVKTVSNTQADAGSLITYTIKAKNNGNDFAQNVIVSDSIDSSKVEFISASDGGDFSNNRISWNFGLAVGEEKTRSFIVKIKEISGLIQLLGNTPVVFEAEDSRGSLNGSMSKGDDSIASAGKYLHVPNDQADDSGSVSYNLDATSNPGTYYLCVNTYWIDTAGNSLSISLDSDLSKVRLGNEETNYNQWMWRQFGQALELSGVHTLTIHGRESGARFDQIKITKSSNCLQ